MIVSANLKKSVDEYLDSIYVISHSHSSVRVYGLAIQHFMEFCEHKFNLPLDEMIVQMKEGSVDPYHAIKDLVIFLDKNGSKPASIKSWMPGIKGFLRHHGIKIYTEDFKSIVKLPKKIHYREEPLTKEILVHVLNNVNPRMRVMILVAVSSGMRLGEILQITVSDIDFQSTPTKIKIRAETTKTRESRETFLTQEATNVLKDYLKKNFGWIDGISNIELGEKIIFGKTKNHNDKKPKEWMKPTPHRSAVSSVGASLQKQLRDVPELSKLNENGVHSIHFHAFRKFFRTTVGNTVGRDYAEALMGHHFYLDTYYNLHEKERINLYLKTEPYLTISDFIKIEKKLLSIESNQQQIVENYNKFIVLLEKNNLEVPQILLDLKSNEQLSHKT